jgi:hypothetical protein
MRMAEPAAPTVAMCVLRAEQRDTGLLVTVTINPDVLAPVADGPPGPAPVGYATDVEAVVHLVKRFLHDFLHGTLDRPDPDPG